MRTATKELCAAASLMLLPILSWAEAVRPAYTPPTPVSGGGLFQMLLSLLLVLGLVLAIAWLLRRFNLPQAGSAQRLRLLSGISVGQRERVVLVEVENTWLVLGVAAGNVRTLHTLPKGKLTEDELDPNAPNFQQWLKHKLEKRDAN